MSPLFMSGQSKINPSYDTVLFDMDGTLLDLAFDNYIWMQCVPRLWAEKNNLSLTVSKEKLYQFYLKNQGTLNWYSSKFWQQQLDIDVLALQQHHQHRIAPRPYCFELLERLKQQGITCWLVTNADCATLQLKLNNIPIADYFSHIVSSESLGYPKEQQGFWHTLQQQRYYEPRNCILVDDNYDVLHSAQQYGIGKLISITEPDSQNPRTEVSTQYPHLQALTDLLDLWPATTEIYGT